MMQAFGSVEDLISNPENFNTQYATVNVSFNTPSDESGVIKSTDGGIHGMMPQMVLKCCSAHGNCNGSH